MTTNRVRPQWTKRPRSQAARIEGDGGHAALVQHEALGAQVKGLSDAELAAEADRLRGEFVADNALALDPEWSRYFTLVTAELHAR